MDPISRAILEAFDRFEMGRLGEEDLAGAADLAGTDRKDFAEALASVTDQGFLRQVGGRFERTELGRLEVAGGRELTLLTRPGCKLCEEALHRIELVIRDLGASLRLVDVDSDGTLRDRYGYDIPVLFLGNREVARHHVHPEELREKLIERRSARESKR